MLFTADEHPHRPPHTWTVEKRGRRWALKSENDVLDTFPTRKAALEARESGFCARLYEKERRWYAGEQIAGWRPYDPPAGLRELVEDLDAARWESEGGATCAA